MNRHFQDIRWMLAQRRAKRIYAKSPDKSFSFGPIKLGFADDNLWAHEKGVFVFRFGAYADTHVLAYGYLDDALEDAAAWLADHAPGHLTEPGCPECDHSRWTQVDDVAYDSQFACDACGHTFTLEDAEQDLTYTESGWLRSHEWTFAELGDPSQLLDYVSRAR